jgi:SNF2 family DNA or RNA helicase
MIKVLIPREKITYARLIEGRQFKEGFWFFPDSSLPRLKELGLVKNDIMVEEKLIKQYKLSPYLRKYQTEIVNTALNYNNYGIFADTGTGKTIMGLEIGIHYNKTLIVCPLSIIESAWIEDCNRFYPHKKILSLWDKSKKKRIEVLNEEADIYVINFDGLKIIYNEILNKGFDCLIIDESSAMKNTSAQITQTILSLGEHIKHKFALSGCPTPNHNSEIFAQMKLINPEILGNNYYGFLAKYFSQDMENPHRWFQTQENKDAFFNRLKEQSVFLKKEDCVDLPEKVFQIRKFLLNKEQRNYYDNMLQDIKDNINTWSKFEFTAKLMKLREIVSGFVIDKDKNVIEFTTEKDKELENVIEDIGDKPIIIWCQFTYEVEKLAKKFNGIALTSKTPNRDKIINDFKNGKIKLLFTNPKILGKGLTFVNCNYNIYYSLSFSYEEFKQSQDRIHRIGQNSKCTYIILQGRNTIDESIYKCLNNKKNVVEELYFNLGLNNKI